MSNAFPAGAASKLKYEGADAATSYGDTRAEWSALDAGAALFDARWRRFFLATGEERRQFLHGQTTANVLALEAGQGCAAATLTAQGRPLAIFALYEDGERLWIATTAAALAPTQAALSRFLVADDCEFEAELAAGCLTVAGPGAARVLAGAGVADAGASAGWTVRSATIGGQGVRLFARGDLRVPAFDVFVGDEDGAAGDLDAVARVLLECGAAPCGVDALEIVRVESGTARYGVDVDESRIAIEARLEWTTHFAKGCYVGQEVVERAVSRGRINHELCLVAATGEIPVGARADGGGERDVVTSAVVSPRSGPIALAYLPRTMTEAGTRLRLLDGDAAIDAVVQSWPRPRTLAGRA